MSRDQRSRAKFTHAQKETGYNRIKIDICSIYSDLNIDYQFSFMSSLLHT